eukprot:TRINITY_DN56984_c0_g1_i1.p1 TRINITY_DN56984_c0_g1~~TRINITY_DN56984_c0_g1_i1.p1  ORF type:complete len:158 (-),score=18.75 TRINITY_DN56984_c0_g1_i1:403-876(-)
MDSDAVVQRDRAIETPSSHPECTSACVPSQPRDIISSRSASSTSSAACSSQGMRPRSPTFDEVAEIHEYVIQPETPPSSQRIESELCGDMEGNAAKVERDEELIEGLCAFTNAADTRKLKHSVTSCLGLHSLCGVLPPMQKSKLWQRRDFGSVPLNP